MYDAIILSDLHLGSMNCRVKELNSFLTSIKDGGLSTRRLILNGDVFDSIDFRRLKKNHWKILSILRSMSDEIEILWIVGNHDGPIDFISHLLGLEVKEEYEFESGEKKILCLHGHRFDQFIEDYPVTSWIADQLYRILQKIDRSHRFAKFAKKSSKTFLRCAIQIEQKAIEYSQTKADIVCCGHSHMATVGKNYFNSGCWTEKPCHYLTVLNGNIELINYVD